MQKRPDMARGAKASPVLNNTRGAAKGTVIFIALQLTAGCSRAPTLNVLGSFFPSWIFCGLLGIALTVVVRLGLVRAGIERHLSPMVVVYPCLTAFFTFTLWLLFYS